MCNKDIDVTKSHLNIMIGCTSYNEALQAMKARTKEVLSKKIQCVEYDNEEQSYIQGHFEIQELQAIYKKCEELGWLDKNIKELR